MDKMKILVVDDESRMRKLVSDFLTRKGYAVIEAADGVEAVDTFMENKDIALIILDVMMPRMDGWEVCRQIRKDSKVPIIMLTAKGEAVSYTHLGNRSYKLGQKVKVVVIGTDKILRTIDFAFA